MGSTKDSRQTPSDVVRRICDSTDKPVLLSFLANSGKVFLLFVHRFEGGHKIVNSSEVSVHRGETDVGHFADLLELCLVLQNEACANLVCINRSELWLQLMAMDPC